jgi:hypothetical protein
MLAVSIEDVGGHVGMGGLLDGQAMASITADCISNDAGGGGAQDHDPIAPIVFDDVGLCDSVTRLHDADVGGRTAEHQDPMRPVLPNAVLDDARKTVLRDLETTERGVLHRVALDDSRCSSVDRDPELSSSDDQALDRDLTPEDLDSGLTCIRSVNCGLALPIDGDAIEFRLYQDVLPTSPLHQDDIRRFQARQGRSHSTSRIAIDSDRFGSDPRDCGEPKPKKDYGYNHPDLLGQFRIYSFAVLRH